MNMPVHINSACGLVTREDGKVLLLRSLRRGWEFPGGVIEQGESPLTALVREIEEETGIVARPVRFVGAYANLSQKPGYGPLEGTMLPPRLILAFLCEYVGGEPRGSSESVEVEWVSREEARSRVTFSTYPERLADMLDYAGQPVFAACESDGQSVRWTERELL